MTRGEQWSAIMADRDYHRRGFVSVWVTIRPIRDIPEDYCVPRYDVETGPVCQFAADFGFDSFDLDFTEHVGGRRPVPLRKLLEPCSYAASFLDAAVATAEAKGLAKTAWVFLLYNFAYDPKRSGVERSEYMAFVGRFPWRSDGNRSVGER